MHNYDYRVIQGSSTISQTDILPPTVFEEIPGSCSPVSSFFWASTVFLVVSLGVATIIALCVLLGLLLF
jgi:hypothetical protein